VLSPEPYRSSFDRFLFVVLASFTAPAFLPAEEMSGDSAVATNELKALAEPRTILRSSVWLDTEWDQYKHGAEKAKWTLAGLWAWHISEQQDWGVRLKVPVVYNRSDEESGHANTGGLGDIEVATGTAFRLSNTWRTGGGIELHADTASNPALDDSVWRLHPSWSVAHDVTGWLTLAATAEYNHSVAEENDVQPERYLELSLPATFILPYDWSIGTRYKAKVDFENDDHWTHTVDLGVSKRLSNVPVVVNVTLEKDLNGGNKKFEINFTMTYYFEK
jgi:hypothetical protein